MDVNTLYLIRHGATHGNKLRRYIGCTDEPLCDETSISPPPFATEITKLFVSPYLRCRETASLMFGTMPQSVVPELRECNFGIFENKSAHDLAQCAAYQAWVDSGCTANIPHGESISCFKARCCAAFLQCAELLTQQDTAAFVIHGGSIMAILEQFALPRKTFYQYHVPNCGTVICDWNGTSLKLIRSLP